MYSEKLKEIICEAKMCPRASFYSGRGVNLGDLNDKHLFKIHDSISNEFGEIARNGFISMVKDLPVLSASEFLESLEILESSNWKWREEFKDHVNGVPADKDNPVGTMFGIFSSLSDKTSRPDKEAQSNHIKDHFLKINLSKEEYTEWKGSVEIKVFY